MLAKVCELDHTELLKIKKLTEAIRQSDFIKSKKLYVDSEQQTILFLHEQSIQTDTTKTLCEQEAVQTMVSMTDKSVQYQTDSLDCCMKSTEVNNGTNSCDKCIQTTIEAKSKTKENTNPRLISNRESINYNGLSRTTSLPEILKNISLEAATQTDMRIINPLLKPSVVPLGMILPYAPVMSPLAALLMPLGNLKNKQQNYYFSGNKCPRYLLTYMWLMYL